ncbi:O70 family O-antigen polymerase, partial [Escherichia coli]|nr:O70 family O-antigen polymerase [Escherichia coli]
YGIGVFRLNLLLITIYSIYDMQKSKFIVVLFILFILYLKFSKKINYWLVTGIPVVSIFLLCSFFILLHNIPMSEVFDSVFARLFIGQTEGSFMIYQALTPDISRIAYGMPLAGLFGISSVDPAAEIITIFFPTAGDAWINSNSYFQAHAWSIFGDLSLILGPLFVALNIMGLFFLKELFSKVDKAYACCVYIVSILTLPIVNDFSYFL